MEEYRKAYKRDMLGSGDPFIPATNYISLMEKILIICMSGGISLGFNEETRCIQAVIIYKGQSYEGQITEDSIHKNPDQVIKSCLEILENIITKNDALPEPKSHRSDFEALDRMDAMKMEGAHFDGEKFTPIPKFDLEALPLPIKPAGWQYEALGIPPSLFSGT